MLWGMLLLRLKNPRPKLQYFGILLLGALIYGTVIEFIQEHYTLSRTADVFDILANLLGMLLGAILGQFLLGRLLSVK